MKAVTFSARIERQDTGMRCHAIPVPDDVAGRFLEAGKTRVVATINGHALRRALQSSKEGGRHLILGRVELKKWGIALGQTVSVRMEPDPEPDTIDLTEEFREVLAQDDAARIRWESFTVGRQRSLAHYLTGAKQPDSRLKRAIEIAEKLRTFTLHGDRPPKDHRG